MLTEKPQGGMPMRLYSVVGSPNSRKVEAVVNLTGLPVEVSYLDFFTGDLRQPDYLALNPNGMVPTLVDDGLVLWESNAIIQYLADKAGAEALFPTAPARRADIVRWLCWELAHYNRALGVLAFEAVAKPGFGLGATNQPAVAIAQAELGRFAPILEAQMRDRHWIAGDGPTIADIALLHLEGFMPMVPFDWSPFPAIRAYAERIRGLDAWTRTAPPSREAVGRRPLAA